MIRECKMCGHDMGHDTLAEAVVRRRICTNCESQEPLMEHEVIKIAGDFQERFNQLAEQVSRLYN